jgi:hypothetical protein
MIRFILSILVLGVLVLIAGVATGFIDLSASGQLKAPKVAVTAEGGEVPKVDVKTKELVVGTTEKNVNLPTVATTNSTIEVPTVAVKDRADAGRQQPKQ